MEVAVGGRGEVSGSGEVRLVSRPASTDTFQFDQPLRRPLIGLSVDLILDVREREYACNARSYRIVIVSVM